MHELSFFDASIFIYFEIFATIIFAVVGGIFGNNALGKNISWLARVSLISACSFLTANGGGTLRDLLVNQQPFWMSQLEYAFIPLVIGALIALLFSNIHLPKTLKVLDDISAGIFVCTGAFFVQKTVGVNDVAFNSLAILFGTLTAIGGGILRDVFIVRKAPIAFKSTYALAAFVGSAWMAFMLQTTANSMITNIVGTMLVVLLFNQQSFGLALVSKASKRVSWT